jgi:hypothetical protein
MLHLGGSGRRRVMAVAAVVLALCVAAPELGAAAGAATPTPAGTSASRPSGTVVLVARRRSHAAVRRARVRAYLKGHPKAVARKLNAHPGLLARALRKKGIPAKAPRASAKHRKKARRYVSPKTRRRRAAAAAKRKRRRRGAALAVGAKHKKSKKKASGHSLSMKDWLEIVLLVLAPFAAVALLLYITDVRRRPRAPSRTKRRRSLVITPLNKG